MLQQRWERVGEHLLMIVQCADCREWSNLNVELSPAMAVEEAARKLGCVAVRCCRCGRFFGLTNIEIKEVLRHPGTFSNTWFRDHMIFGEASEPQPSRTRSGNPAVDDDERLERGGREPAVIPSEVDA